MILADLEGIPRTRHLVLAFLPIRVPRVSTPGQFVKHFGAASVTNSNLCDLRDFLQLLRQEGELVEVEASVDPAFEAPEIHRRIIAAGGPAILFRNPKNSSFPLVTNLFGNKRRVDLAFGEGPRRTVEEMARLPEELMPPTLGRLWSHRSLFGRLARVGLKTTRSAPVLDQTMSPARLSELPVLTTWEEDGGPFVTLPLVYTEHPENGGHNLGMYRLQIHDDEHTGMHFQIGKGGGAHLAVAEQLNQNLPCHVFLGGPPALIVSAIAPLPENVPELLLASLLVGQKMSMAKSPYSSLPVSARAEFCLVGEILAGTRKPEGPFGDHYGYYSLKHDYPVFKVKAVHHRRDAIYPATVVGKPRQEDFFIGDYLQELLSPLFPVVMPAVVDLWSYGETGYHSLAAAVVKQRYKKEAMASAFRILGEGQLSLTKFLLLTDSAVDLRDFKATLEHVLARCEFETDVFIFANLSMDTLDYTGPQVNEGSKGVMLGLGEAKRPLKGEFSGSLIQGVKSAKVYCRGCLVLGVEASAKGDTELPQRIADSDEFRDWPMIVLVDDAEVASRSDMNFLWTTFTRFEPAADVYTRARTIVRNHRAFSAPIVIDARMKPNYPDELFCDEKTKKLVDKRWQEYFPRGQEMGDSDAAHLD